MLEFGPSRETSLALRARLLDWQLRLRIIFIARIALLKYRLRLSGFELPEAVLKAQQTFNAALARRMDEIADHLQKTSHLPQHREPLLQLIAEPVKDYTGAEPDATATRLQSLLPLCARIDSLVTSLADEIAAGG
ncbi:MAG TPA: hypothetical protein VLZ50_16695 [Terracidiphilus sp.]|nr:hypothetical protein [Terracidiphilus sp.]